MALPHDTTGLSVVCDCGILIILTYYIYALFVFLYLCFVQVLSFCATCMCHFKDKQPHNNYRLGDVQSIEGDPSQISRLTFNTINIKRNVLNCHIGGIRYR